MGLFSKSKSYLGVDLGTASVKIIELANQDGKPRLLTYGYLDWSTDIMRNTAPEAKNKVAAMIKAICEKSQTRSRKAVTALPSFSVFNSIINLPRMSKKDLSSAIYWEAKKFVPMPIEEVILDWKILEPEISSNYHTIDNKKKEEYFVKNQEMADSDFKNKSPKENNEPSQKSDNKNLRILLTAAPKNLVKKYIDIFEQAELELLSLETESFALGRSLVGGDRATVMVIDLGATTTDIIIMKSGIPLLSRSIDIGGMTITKSIVNTLNIGEKRAEQFKRDIGISLAAAAGSLADQTQGQLSNGFNSAAKGWGGVPRAIREVMDSLINEIRYSLDLYQTQSGEHVEKVILSGGSAFLPNLSEYFAQMLEIKVFIGDPWSRVIYPTELKFSLEELGPCFAVAIGLAMREIE